MSMRFGVLDGTVRTLDTFGQPHTLISADAAASAARIAGSPAVAVASADDGATWGIAVVVRDWCTSTVEVRGCEPREVREQDSRRWQRAR